MFNALRSVHAGLRSWMRCTPRAGLPHSLPYDTYYRTQMHLPERLGRVVASKTLKDTHPSLFAEIAPLQSGNVTLVLDTLPVDCGNILDWKCSVCSHTWSKSVIERVYLNRDCPKCFEKNHPSLHKAHPEIASEWNAAKNPLHEHPKYINAASTKKIWWKCVKCKNEWEEKVKDRVRGKGCPICQPSAGQWVSEHPRLAREWHQLRNGDLRPEKCTTRTHRAVWWLCSYCGFEFEARIAERVSGRECESCQKEKPLNSGSTPMVYSKVDSASSPKGDEPSRTIRRGRSKKLAPGVGIKKKGKNV